MITKRHEHTYHLTAWFLTSDILSSTSDKTVFNTLFSTGSSPWKEVGSCLISVIRSFRPMNLSLIVSWWGCQEWIIFDIHRKSWSGDCIWNYRNEINRYWEYVSRFNFTFSTRLFIKYPLVILNKDSYWLSTGSGCMVSRQKRTCLALMIITWGYILYNLSFPASVGSGAAGAGTAGRQSLGKFPRFAMFIASGHGASDLRDICQCPHRVWETVLISGWKYLKISVEKLGTYKRNESTSIMDRTLPLSALHI